MEIRLSCKEDYSCQSQDVQDIIAESIILGNQEEEQKEEQLYAQNSQKEAYGKPLRQIALQLFLEIDGFKIQLIRRKMCLIIIGHGEQDQGTITRLKSYGKIIGMHRSFPFRSGHHAAGPLFLN